jgi:hypothetical protein
MGLDMYLSKKKYLGWNYEHRREGVTLPDLSEFGIDSKKVTYIEESVAYWRKSNAIHMWFVDNVQEGNDDCKDYYVDTDKLNELLKIVSEVLDKHDNEYAMKRLPPTEGFFFGSKEIDEYYWVDLTYTKDILVKALEDKEKNSSFYYSSSW